MIRLNDIVKSYPLANEELVILKNINLEITKGEFVAIMGPSGSGKSTLMNIIGCLDKPTSGQYELNEKFVSEYSDKELAKVRNESIGFVFQQFQLLPRLTALQNVELPLIYAGVRKKERQERAKAALERVGLADRMDHLPNELSGGQKQRVAIARAIVNNPSIILADEPTGALDTKTGRQIMEIFTMLNKEGTTIILVTHEPEIASFAERTIFVRDGQITSAEEVVDQATVERLYAMEEPGTTSERKVSEQPSEQENETIPNASDVSEQVEENKAMTDEQKDVNQADRKEKAALEVGEK